MRGAPLGLPGLTAVIPNLYATFAEAPAVLQGYLALSDSLDTGALTAAERQIAEIAISAENSCAHCVAAHLTIGDMLKVSPEVVDAIREGRSLPDARLDRPSWRSPEQWSASTAGCRRRRSRRCSRPGIRAARGPGSRGPERVWAPPPEGSVAQALAAAFPDVPVIKGFNHFGAEILAESGAGDRPRRRILRRMTEFYPVVVADGSLYVASDRARGRKPVDPQHLGVLDVEERYAVIVNGKKIGTVRLDPTRRGSVRARLAPLPAFRVVARHRRVLAAARERELNEEEPTPAELAAADGADAVLASLRLSLATDPGGAPVPTRAIELLRGDPPHLQIEW